MKLSEVTTAAVKKYIGVSSNDADEIISIVMDSAKSYITGYTGLNTTELDELSDIPIAFLVLCNDMYSNRDYTVERSELNPTAKQILDMHSVNLLPKVVEE